MKAVNIILSVLVLIMALASAVFSYFLFEKRTEMLGGWEKFAVTVNRTSAELDKNSGTKVAGELTTAALSHENYAGLDAKLNKLTAQSRKIIAERDALADALVRIARNVGVRSNEKALREIATYAAAKDAVINGVADAVAKRDRACAAIAQILRSEYNVNINPKSLANADNGSINAIRKAVRDSRQRREHYESRMRGIGRRGGLRPAETNFNADNYRVVSTKVGSAVDRLWRDRQRLGTELSRANAKNRQLQRLIEGNRDAMAQLKSQLDESNRRMSGYRRALNIADGADMPMPWVDGSDEVRAKLVGEVIKINEDYGYVVINLGKNTTVEQVIGDRKLAVNPKLNKGFEMIVTRGELANKAGFVARITLDEVGDDCSTANIPVDAKDIKVGDKVYFGTAK